MTQNRCRGDKRKADNCGATVRVTEGGASKVAAVKVTATKVEIIEIST